MTDQELEAEAVALYPDPVIPEFIGMTHKDFLTRSTDYKQAVERRAAYIEGRKKTGIKLNIPTNKQLTEIALLFNEGVIDIPKLTDMIAMTQYVLDRLNDNNDVMKKSLQELKDDQED